MSVIRSSQSFVVSRDWMNSAQIGKASGVSRGVSTTRISCVAIRSTAAASR